MISSRFLNDNRRSNYPDWLFKRLRIEAAELVIRPRAVALGVTAVLDQAIARTAKVRR